ncbi:HAE1 family hydrophobic/amphiphilic exporter-1 [Leucobacter exalbidus]|uniref:HAE1 family hydrophobic/amphiphilic exporter-1 n=1 Tax=Leucobacter exalbidus TaxID=662960 RepID=A0A940PNK4_9MICO|nr:efflux RND transporter permease subunit [Leucobacter exalbidus]MBP1326453.1 HAE1 family hydrophobic/amphiphilic exporter-1 [Leucobacter exalbidus]
MHFLTLVSLKNRLIVGLATIAVAVIGVFSMGALKQELMPTMQAPMAYVSVQSQGLAPEEMSRVVSEPLEQAIAAVPGVTDVTSYTSSGYASINASWKFTEGDDETMQALRAATDAVRAGLPTGTEVEVYSGGTDGMPAMMLSAGTTGDEAAFGDALQQTVVPALQSIAGVQKVDLGGRLDERVVISLREEDANRLGVEPTQIAAVLQANGVALPAGEARSKSGSMSVTVGTALGATTTDEAIEAIGALPIQGKDGVVRVSDFADVAFETVPAESISRVNGKPALTLQITPAQGANVVDISHEVNAQLDELAPSLKAEFVALFDQAPYIEQSIHDLSVEGGLGLLFAVLVILAFLGSWRSTVIAAVSIPLSLLITLIGLQWTENTLNMLTLGALTIAIGRVVDDSIVVIENISRRRGTGELTPAGVVASVRQVAGAITASTLTTVAVFLPIALVSGVAGQLFRPFAVTVSIALLASLFVALTIVPVLAFWFMRGGKSQRTGGASASHPASDLDEIHTPPDRLQRAIMPALSATRRRPAITLIVSSLMLVGSLALMPFITTDFLGSSGNESLQLTQTPPKGTTGSKKLIAAAEPVEAALSKVPGVRDVMTTIPVGAGESGAGPTTISYSVQLADDAQVDVVEPAVQRTLDKLENAGELMLLTEDSYTAGAGGDDIALQIQGNDPAALRAASDLLEQQLTAVQGVKAVKSELSGEQPVLRVKLDEAKAMSLGFDRAMVATAIRDALEGSNVGQLMFEGQERAIIVRTPGTERSAKKLGELLLPVTPQQTANAQKVEGDRLQEEAKAEAEAARMQANTELSNQIIEAANARAEAAAQLPALNAQLEALLAAPVAPEPPRTPEEDSQVRASTERAEQIAALQGAIAGAQGGIEGLDEQIAALQTAQTEAANQLAEQQAAEAEQKAAAEVTGKPLPLSAIATVEEELTSPTIMRANGERQVTLMVTPEKGQMDAASAAIDDAIATADLPAGVSFQLSGVGAEQDDAFAQLGVAMLAAIMLVLLVMVATFRNFRGPFVLLVSIPFAATGAILGLLLTDTPLGLPALIGLLMLIGIVVTNAIVLMDLINRLRAGGATLNEAVEHGTRLRLRPILMTAAATIFALIPMSLGLTGGGVFISKPLAIVVIGGLISSTLLTLVLVPVLYTMVERSRDRKLIKRRARAVRRLAGRDAQAAAGTGSLSELGELSELSELSDLGEPGSQSKGAGN